MRNFLPFSGIRLHIGIRTCFCGAAVARGCDCAPAAWLPQNMGAAPCPQTRLGQQHHLQVVVKNENPSAQTRFRLFSDSPLYIEPKGLSKFTLRRDTCETPCRPSAVPEYRPSRHRLRFFGACLWTRCYGSRNSAPSARPYILNDFLVP